MATPSGGERVLRPADCFSLAAQMQTGRGCATMAREGKGVEPHSIVIVSLHSPKEKLWGELLSIHAAGITLRGIDLNYFDEFVRRVLHPEGERVGLPTLFFPMARIERIALDEPSGSIPSLAERFEQKVGRSLLDYLALFA
ncbi:MAG TPA: hypothetical protein VHM88_08755 [Candidatus Acidoferrales bacterium]|nr:hypothetical protein [Candidatus Acidoferrales bacterium]